MDDFYTVINYVNKMIYEPNDLTVESIQEEKQNYKYCDRKYQLSYKSIRQIVATITATKVEQFFEFWEKLQNNKNQPYLYDEAPDLLAITTFKNEDEFAQ